jgi:NAD(P)-dependent dehydrogenase (short-subunit alcohol dehydrogenase family)
MDSVTGRWALVTGASSGFGLEFATLLAKRGANLVLAARRKEPMERLAERLQRDQRIDVAVETLDLSEADAAAQRTQRGWLKKETRRDGETWVLFFRTTRKSDGKRVESKIPIGLVENFPEKSQHGPKWNDCTSTSTDWIRGGASPSAI